MRPVPIAIATLGTLVVGLSVPLTAQQGPCAQITTACKSAGFTLGAGSAGTGLLADCVVPIMQGIAQPAAAVRPLPQITPQLVTACKASNPHFGQGPAPAPTADIRRAPTSGARPLATPVSPSASGSPVTSGIGVTPSNSSSIAGASSLRRGTAATGVILTLIKTRSHGPLTKLDIQTALGSTVRPTQAGKKPMTVLSYSSFASLTPASPYASGNAGLGAYSPFQVNFGGGGALGNAAIELAPITVRAGSSIAITLIAQANQVYVFDMSFSPMVLPGGATTGTFSVSASALSETDIVPMPATGGNPTYHLGFAVSAPANEQIVVYVSSPDTYWLFNKCDISH
jgi:hypothetical protein